MEVQICFGSQVEIEIHQGINIRTQQRSGTEQKLRTGQRLLFILTQAGKVADADIAGFFQIPDQDIFLFRQGVDVRDTAILFGHGSIPPQHETQYSRKVMKKSSIYNRK